MDLLKSVLLTALIFVPLEQMLALHPRQQVFRRGWTNDLFYLLLNGQITSLCVGVLLVGMTITAAWLVPVSVRTAIAGQPYWQQIIEVVILSDIGVYFVHRTFHTVPWLWKVHAIHHSSEEIDWLSAARNHPLELIVTKGFSLLPVFMLGFSDIAIGGYMVLYVLQTFFIHANLRIKFGPLRWLWASPEFHRWHHSTDPTARGKNFSGFLPLLDVLFGTFYMPRGQVPTEYGVGLDEPIPATYLAQLLYPFHIPAPENRPVTREACAEAVTLPVTGATSHHPTMHEGV